MEKPEYRVEDVPRNTQRKFDQLNNMFKDGYEFVAVAMNQVIYKKVKKHKND